jgi:predicted nucleic acid-binding protein
VAGFWDTSAVVPLLVYEPESVRVRKLLREDGQMLVWWATRVECLSALSRLGRQGLLTQTQGNGAREALASFVNSWSEISPADRLRSLTGRLLEMHHLKAGDSLQLAAALVWSEMAPARRAFVSLDGRLREAARKEGFTVQPSDRTV